jgi:selenocysteine-specific elongation factor
MPIVGTAGHVDHGKSTLVQALTGTDPDRWVEEKERGLTIDLGFAWADIGGHDVGFVDVPGHERFIKNMLAGVGAVDCALLVVAADSGWMPQTEEHASVLDLLDIERGIIAITRIDLVDTDTIELATLEVMDEVVGTRLENWPVVPVSSVTGAGIEDLRTAIIRALAASNPSADGPLRLWVDRAFHISGAGQVVTGTVMEGTISESDDLEVLPSGESIKVRSLQHHGGPVATSASGSRTAVNVAGARAELARGDLLTTPGHADVTKRLLATIDPTRAVEEIPNRGAFHLHVGTASRPARIRRLGESNAFVIDLEEPIPAVVGDGLILRDSGRRAVVGGGRVLDTRPTRRPTTNHVDLLVSAVAGSRDERADALLTVHGSLAREAITAATAGGSPTRAVTTPIGWLSTSEMRRIAEAAEAAAADYHEQHPVRPGIPKAELASHLRIDATALDVVIDRAPGVEESKGAIRVSGFSNELAPAEESRWRQVRTGLEEGFDVPRFGSIDLDTETVHFLLRRGDLVRIADDLAFTADQIEAITSKVSELPDGFTVSDFRDHFGMTRRQAVPTLEWLDSIGRTRRSGDGRSVRS